MKVPAEAAAANSGALSVIVVPMGVVRRHGTMTAEWYDDGGVRGGSKTANERRSLGRWCGSIRP